jgi:hypothetical protein
MTFFRIKAAILKKDIPDLISLERIWQYFLKIDALNSLELSKQIKTLFPCREISQRYKFSTYILQTLPNFGIELI